MQQVGEPGDEGSENPSPFLADLQVMTTGESSARACKAGQRCLQTAPLLTPCTPCHLLCL